MSFAEKVTSVSAVVTVLAAGWYGLTVGGQLGGAPVPEIAYQRPMLVAIGAMIVLTIAGTIAVAIATAIRAEVTGEGPVDDIDRKDERDAHIGARGDRVAGLDLAGDQLAGLRFERCDVTDPGAVDAAIDAIVRDWGRIDFLVNNACLAVFAPFEERDLDTTRREFEVNFFGYLHLIATVVPHMKRQGGGVIHNVGSTVGSTGFAGLSGYASTKGAIEALTRTLAIELAPHGIAVNLVHPPLTRTPSAVPLGVPPPRRRRGRAPERAPARSDRRPRPRPPNAMPTSPPVTRPRVVAPACTGVPSGMRTLRSLLRRATTIVFVSAIVTAGAVAFAADDSLTSVVLADDFASVTGFAPDGAEAFRFGIDD